MAERTVTIDDAEPLLLFGFNDIYLKKIQKAVSDASITARGNQLILKGDAPRLDHVERILGELVFVLRRNGNLTENDVDTVLELLTFDNGATGVSGRDAQNTILYTPSGSSIKARTPNQMGLVEAARLHDIVFAIGPAGTGKTYTAVALAVNALKSKQVQRIVLCRPAVEAGERLGFLPGDLREKVDPYLRPLYDALEDMVHRSKRNELIEQETVEILPLAYMRGRTLHSAFVILDEAQNATSAQMKMFLTRLGTGSRCIVTGDVTQIDLGSDSQSGLVHASHILDGVEGISFVTFDEGDVVRHQLVKDIIQAYDRHDRTSSSS